MTAVNLNRAVRGPVTAVPIVAGTGVRLVADTQNNRWLVEADETVLWDDTSWVTAGDVTAGTNSGTLSETITNFERIRIYYSRSRLDSTSLPSQMMSEYDCSTIFGQSGLCLISATFLPSDRNSLRMADTLLTFSGTTFTETDGGQCNLTASSGSYDKSKVYLHPYKIVGINRIASN